jgi:hypothetical protein
MKTLLASAAMLALLIAPASASDFEESELGYIEFNMPSGNIGCVYTPEGGSKVHTTEDGLAELSCDRVQPDYVRVTMSAEGEAEEIEDVQDASCCGAENIFEYDDSWEEGPFKCESSISGLTCTNGEHGFKMARKGIKTW